MDDRLSDILETAQTMDTQVIIITNGLSPSEQQRPVGKETGEMAHIERWNNTLRKQLARFVRT